MRGILTIEEGRVPASDFMAGALAEARCALGWTSPNPAVGAVVVRDGEVVGAGRTQPPGGNHAEVEALADAGEAARGATVYVTLEPCSHQGRTPPCVDALIEAGVEAVRYAVADPDPNVVEETIGKRLLPGLGDIDLPGLLRILDETGRQGPTAVEVFSDWLRGHPIEEGARLAAEAARTVLAAAR